MFHAPTACARENGRQDAARRYNLRVITRIHQRLRRRTYTHTRTITRSVSGAHYSTSANLRPLARARSANRPKRPNARTPSGPNDDRRRRSGEISPSRQPPSIPDQTNSPYPYGRVYDKLIKYYYVRTRQQWFTSISDDGSSIFTTRTVLYIYMYVYGGVETSVYLPALWKSYRRREIIRKTVFL